MSEQMRPPSSSVRCVGPASAFERGFGRPPAAANGNSPRRLAGRESPKRATESEILAVEAIYLGADILEALKCVQTGVNTELAAETGRLAKMLMAWGANVGTLSSGA